MDEAKAVNALNSHEKLCGVKPGHLFRHDLLEFAHEGEEVSARIVLHHQVQKLVILEAIMKAGEPLLVGIQQNLSLFLEHGGLISRSKMAGGIKKAPRNKKKKKMNRKRESPNLLSPEHLPLIQDLHGVDIIIKFGPNQMNLKRGRMQDD